MIKIKYEIPIYYGPSLKNRHPHEPYQPSRAGRVFHSFDYSSLEMLLMQEYGKKR